MVLRTPTLHYCSITGGLIYITTINYNKCRPSSTVYKIKIGLCNINIFINSNKLHSTSLKLRMRHLNNKNI